MACALHVSSRQCTRIKPLTEILFVLARLRKLKQLTFASRLTFKPCILPPVGLLITGGDEREGGGEVHALRMEVSTALSKLHSSQREIVRLKGGAGRKFWLFSCDCVFDSCFPTTFFFEPHHRTVTLALTWQGHTHVRGHSDRTTGAIARSAQAGIGKAAQWKQGKQEGAADALVEQIGEICEDEQNAWKC